MTEAELTRAIQDLIYSNRQVEAALDQSFRSNSFLFGTLVTTILCVALFCLGIYIVRHMERNGENARLRTKGYMAVQSSNSYRQDYFWARRRLDNLTAIIEQLQVFLKDMPPRFGHEAEQQRLLNECITSLAEGEIPPEPESLPQAQAGVQDAQEAAQKRSDRVKAFWTSIGAASDRR